MYHPLTGKGIMVLDLVLFGLLSGEGTLLKYEEKLRSHRCGID